MNTTASKLPPLATLGPFIALLLACGFFALQSDRFLTGQNFALILQQVMVVGVIAVAMRDDRTRHRPPWMNRWYLLRMK